MREQIQQAIDLRDAVVTCFISGDGGELGCDVGRLYDLIDAALRAAKVEALREMKTALTSQSGTSAWDVVSYIEARIVDHIAKLDARATLAAQDAGKEDVSHE